MSELHDLTTAKLQEQMQQVQKDLALARLEQAANRLEDTSKPYHLRKKLARIKTVIREKELWQEAKQKILSKQDQTKESNKQKDK
jgi:large subunit ribosomal protein L29